MLADMGREIVYPGLVKSLPRSLNRRRMAASMALGDYNYILDSRPTGAGPIWSKWPRSV